MIYPCHDILSITKRNVWLHDHCEEQPDSSHSSCSNNQHHQEPTHNYNWRFVKERNLVFVLGAFVISSSLFFDLFCYLCDPFFLCCFVVVLLCCCCFVVVLLLWFRHLCCVMLWLLSMWFCCCVCWFVVVGTLLYCCFICVVVLLFLLSIRKQKSIGTRKHDSEAGKTTPGRMGKDSDGSTRDMSVKNIQRMSNQMESDDGDGCGDDNTRQKRRGSTRSAVEPRSYRDVLMTSTSRQTMT